MGAWPWRRTDRAEDRTPPVRPSARPVDGTEPPAAPPQIRLGVDVLPVPGRAPRRAGERARRTGRPDGAGASVGPGEEVDDAVSGAEADPHVRRVLAMAELSLLVLDQD